MLWFSVARFGVRVSVSFHLTCVYLIFSSVSVAELPPFGKYLLTRLTICSLFILTICYISYFPFWFEGWSWVLIALVPDLCILFTLTILILYSFFDNKCSVKQYKIYCGQFIPSGQSRKKNPTRFVFNGKIIKIKI